MLARSINYCVVVVVVGVVVVLGVFRLVKNCCSSAWYCVMTYIHIRISPRYDLGITVISRYHGDIISA